MTEVSDNPANEDVAKNDYYTELNMFYSKRSESSTKKPWTQNRILEVIQILRSYKNPSPENKRECKHYNNAKKYDLMDIGDATILILKRQTQDDPIIQIVPVEKYYDELLHIHESVGHGGRDKMLYALKNKYFIPRPAVEIFIKLCQICNSKKSLPKKGLVVRPVLSKEFNVRGQLDVIDLRSTPDKEFKWLMSYQDYATKFSHLRPLKTDYATEIALELLKIFLEFGAPHVLQSDSGREFTASIIKEVASLWPDCKMVHGNVPNCESQGRVERSDQDVENMLRTWMKDNNSSSWLIGCYFVQFHKNSSVDRTINRSPYKALFGANPKVGLDNISIPRNILSTIYSEEDLQEFLNRPEDDNNDEDTNNDMKNEEFIYNDLSYECDKSECISTTCSLCQQPPHTCCVTSGTKTNILCHMSIPEDEIKKEELQAAENMLESPAKKFKHMEIDCCESVIVPKLEPEPDDEQNLLDQLAEYEDPIATDIPPRLKIADNQITLREAAALGFKFDEQGFNKCTCKPSKNQCNTKRCCCNKSGMICNSKCHGNNACVNK